MLTFDTPENWSTTETTSHSPSITTLENNTLEYLNVHKKRREEVKDCWSAADGIFLQVAVHTRKNFNLEALISLWKSKADCFPPKISKKKSSEQQIKDFKNQKWHCNILQEDICFVFHGVKKIDLFKAESFVRKVVNYYVKVRKA